MSDLKKYEGVIPAFYACYDDAVKLAQNVLVPWYNTLLIKVFKGFMSTVLQVNVSTKA